MGNRETYARVTAQVVAAMQSGVLPWRRPWRTIREAGGATMPCNAVTRRCYRGANTVVLWHRGDSDMRYLTYRQAQARGGYVRKGEHGTKVFFWQSRDLRTTDDDGVDHVRRGLLVREYVVFNVAQCDGLSLPAAPVVDHSVAPTVEQFRQKIGAVLRTGGDQAFFNVAGDYVNMPARGAFTSDDAYTATAFHEFTHWSGHASRLAREFGARFGDHAYACEELVAELGAAYLCAHYGVDGGLEQHASYLKSWLAGLSADPGYMITAASKAQAAADYLIARDSRVVALPIAA